MTVALYVVTGVAFLLAGAVARRRRPDNRVGELMGFAGTMWLVAALSETSAPLTWTVGMAVVTVGKAALLHLLLAFPSGRLGTRLDRWLVGALYLDTTIGSLALMAVTDDPRNLLLVSADADLATLVHTLQRVVGLVVALAAIAVLVGRWQSASPPLRRALGPVLAVGLVTVALAASTIAASGVSDVLYDALTLAQITGFAVLPFAFLAGLLRSWLSRTGVAELVLDLRETPEPGRLRDTLARTLGDPSLRVAYRVQDGYRDLAGAPLVLPEHPRAVTRVSHAGREVAALVHDPALSQDAELLEAVGAAAGLALENERLQAQLRASLGDLRASRARLVRASDEERRRLERNLHDGAQQRLVSLALALGLAESMLAEDDDPDEARAVIASAKIELGAAIEELRELARGLHPAILAERGLPFALEALAERARMPVDLDVLDERLPPPVEAALYYVAAEAVTNAARHAQARRLAMRVARDNGSVVLAVSDDGRGGASGSGDGRSSGLRGLADRVEALDGRLWVDSPPGAGTTVRAEIPCGS